MTNNNRTGEFIPIAGRNGQQVVNGVPYLPKTYSDALRALKVQMKQNKRLRAKNKRLRVKNKQLTEELFRQWNTVGALMDEIEGMSPKVRNHVHEGKEVVAL